MSNTNTISLPDSSIRSRTACHAHVALQSAHKHHACDSGAVHMCAMRWVENKYAIRILVVESRLWSPLVSSALLFRQKRVPRSFASHTEWYTNQKHHSVEAKINNTTPLVQLYNIIHIATHTEQHCSFNYPHSFVGSSVRNGQPRLFICARRCVWYCETRPSARSRMAAPLSIITFDVVAGVVAGVAAVGRQRPSLSSTLRLRKTTLSFGAGTQNVVARLPPL